MKGAHELLRDFSEFDPILFLILSYFVRSLVDEDRGHIYYLSTIRLSKLLHEREAIRMSIGARPLKYLLWWLIAGTRGGVTRAKIIQAINTTPQNANQLAIQLGVDYRTIRHHIQVLEKNRIITSAGEGYGTTYFLSQVMEENYALFEEILNKIWKK